MFGVTVLVLSITSVLLFFWTHRVQLRFCKSTALVVKPVIVEARSALTRYCRARLFKSYLLLMID